jgi:uncharacterized DUF497 family protein
MKIDWLVWDQRTKIHIARHGIQLEETEEIIQQRHHIRKARKGYYAVQGQTYSGRYLLLIVDYLGDGRAYVVTARELTDSERYQFRRTL